MFSIVIVCKTRSKTDLESEVVRTFITTEPKGGTERRKQKLSRCWKKCDKKETEGNF